MQTNTTQSQPKLVGRINSSAMRRMIESQHAVQYGYRLLHPTECGLRVFKFVGWDDVRNLNNTGTSSVGVRCLTPIYGLNSMYPTVA